MSLKESADKAAASADLSLAFHHYAPNPKYTLGVADPRHLVDSAGLHPALNAAPILGNLADAASTARAIDRGGIEANPLVRPVIDRGGNGALFAVKAGVGIGLALAADKLARDGHKRAAKVLAILGGAVPLGAAIHNERQGR